MTRNQPFTTLDQQLCFELYAASHAFTKLYKPLLEPLGLTYPQYLVMLLLWEQDNRSVGDLGQRLDLETNTLTPLLKRMEVAGLLSRARDPQDERRVRIALSDRGRALQQQARRIPQCLDKAGVIRPEEAAALRDQVKVLRQALVRASKG